MCVEQFQEEDRNKIINGVLNNRSINLKIKRYENTFCEYNN